MPPHTTRELFTFGAMVTVAADSREEALARIQQELAAVDARGDVRLAILESYPAATPATTPSELTR